MFIELDRIKNHLNIDDYYTDDDEYVCNNRDQVDEEWCDEEMLRSIEHAYQDIGFFLGR